MMVGVRDGRSATFPDQRTPARVRRALRLARDLVRLAGRPRLARQAYLLRGSGLFDASFYMSQNPDVSAAGIHPLLHYVLSGSRERRRPHPLFDPTYYLQRAPDVARSGLDPLIHFLLHGAAEERNPSPYFDTRYYLASNPDVRASGVNPLAHFVRGGWREGRSPSPWFDCRGYLARYEDVRSAGVNPLVHFVTRGAAEGRDTSAVTPAPLAALPPTRLDVQRLNQASPTAPRSGRPIVVCVTHVCPWPPHAGNAYRILRLLSSLQREGFGIVPVIAPLPGENIDDAAIRTIVELFSNVVIAGRDGSVRYFLRDAPDALASLHGGQTARFSAMLGEEHAMSQRERELLTIDRTYCHDGLIAVVLALHSALQRYVLLTEYVWMTRLLPLVDTRALKVLDTIDVFSTKPSKVLQFGIQDLWLEPDEEARRLRQADLVVAIQPEEHEILQRLAPKTRVVTAGIDFDVTRDARLPAGHRILYVGSDNLLNVQGVRDFLDRAWPSVRARVPDAELLVAGPVSEAIVENVTGVKKLGRVATLDEAYRSARVVINPARAGTGIKIKTVEALCRFRPLVSWPAGVDGLPPELKALCDVVEDWSEFGARVSQRLLAESSEGFSDSARRRIADATSPKTVYTQLSSALRELWPARLVQ